MSEQQEQLPTTEELLRSLEKQVGDLVFQKPTPMESKIINALAVLTAIVLHEHNEQKRNGGK